LKRITKEVIREMERNAILQALRANQWNRRKTAEALKISYRALIYKISEAGLSSKSSASNSITPSIKSNQRVRKWKCLQAGQYQRVL